MSDLSQVLDFMEDEDGFMSPPMPSVKHPQGRQYRVASPDAKTGLRLNALADIMVKKEMGVAVAESDVARLRLNDDAEREFVRQVLGATYLGEDGEPTNALDEMVADEVKSEHLKRIAQYAYIYFGVSKEAAEEARKNGLLSGKLVAPLAANRAARRKGGKKKKSQA